MTVSIPRQKAKLIIKLQSDQAAIGKSGSRLPQLSYLKTAQPGKLDFFRNRLSQNKMDSGFGIPTSGFVHAA
jgi:hypothetical protein